MIKRSWFFLRTLRWGLMLSLKSLLILFLVTASLAVLVETINPILGDRELFCSEALITKSWDWRVWGEFRVFFIKWLGRRLVLGNIYAASFFLPLKRRRLRMFLPALDLILEKKPWTLERRRFLGWNVCFILGDYNTEVGWRLRTIVDRVWITMYVRSG